MTIQAPKLGGATTRPIWEANLVAGALRDEIHALDLPPELMGSEISLQLGDGRLLSGAVGGIGNVIYDQEFLTDKTTVIEERIRSAAAGAGLTVRSVDVLDALQAAPAVVIEADDPAGAASIAGQLAQKIFGDVTQYEGFYFEIDNSVGQPVFTHGSAFRIGAHQQWASPELLKSD